MFVSKSFSRTWINVKDCTIACLFEALGKVSPTNNSDIKAFSRFVPMCRSKPMPIQSFIHSFAVWGDNSVIYESAKVKDNNIFNPDLYYTAIRFVIKAADRKIVLPHTLCLIYFSIWRFIYTWRIRCNLVTGKPLFSILVIKSLIYDVGSRYCRTYFAGGHSFGGSERPGLLSEIFPPNSGNMVDGRMSFTRNCLADR